VSAGARRLGPFTVTGELGRGGMGTVLRARDPANREVALKLGPAGASDERRARFEREGQIAAGLDHPGIVGVHAAGALPDGRPYLAFELVEGARNLDAAFAGAPRERRVGWVLEAARAVAHAHARGVVHRDLKPANVLVARDGRVRVADFGVAGMVGLDRLTRTGQLLGTPTHMAPEQLAGERRAVGPPADVWALGALLYEALTGEPPFAGASLLELIAAVERGPRPPRAVAPDVAPALEAVCLAALARRPADRPPDAAAFAAALEGARAGEPVGRGRRRPARWAAALVLGGA